VGKTGGGTAKFNQPVQLAAVNQGDPQL